MWGDIHIVWDSWVTRTAESGLYLADEEDFEVAAISKYGPSLADSAVLLTPCDQGVCCVFHAAAQWSCVCVLCVAALGNTGSARGSVGAAESNAGMWRACSQARSEQGKVMGILQGESGKPCMRHPGHHGSPTTSAGHLLHLPCWAGADAGRLVGS